jgi:1,2-diacylglycerol 3-beta-galactosyltransferase
MNLHALTRGEGQAVRVELIYFDAGGGHRASAAALQRVLAERRPRWHVDLVNLRSELDGLDFVRRLTGVRLENFYNGLLRQGVAVGIGAMLRILHLAIGRMHLRMVPPLAETWARRQPDLVVSMIPHFNRAIFAGLCEATRRTHGWGAPMVTVMTDLADYPPHFWIEAQDQYVVCGTAAAAGQALAAGLPSELVLRSSGMIVRPEFYTAPRFARAAERQRLGLDPELATGVVMFGGFGSRRMETIARELAQVHLPAQMILLCGRNEELRKRLAAMRLPFPHHVAGFTEDVPRFMRLADFFIGKPGPGSISEALVAGLPLIVERNALTMVHERFNTDWVRHNGLGVVVRSFAEIGAAVARMLEPATMDGFRRNVAAHENRAVFELPEMLAGVLEAGRRAGADVPRLSA